MKTRFLVFSMGDFSQGMQPKELLLGRAVMEDGTVCELPIFGILGSKDKIRQNLLDRFETFWNELEKEDSDSNL